MIKCFFAYAGKTPSVCEAIENAIKEINDNNYEAYIQGWKMMNISGKIIINTICNDIDNSSVFIADLTDLNDNVLFELGYAIAKNKRIWLTKDSSINSSKSLNLLDDIGYTDYQNSYDLRDKFFIDKPYKSLDETIYKKRISEIKNVISISPFQVMYLKSYYKTESSVQLQRLINEYTDVDIIVDDPQEMENNTLDWYIENLLSSGGLITHFTSDNRDGTMSNAKYSLVSGLCHGLQIPLLMLAHDPYITPIDFQQIMNTHKNSKQCRRIAKQWLDDDIIYPAEDISEISGREKVLKATALNRISVGYYLAENEKRTLENYFIQTNEYTKAKTANEYMLFIGRKGSGKTANLLQLQSELASEESYHVCTIRPDDYELSGILNIFEILSENSQHGFLLESIWKFLIYTELAKSTYFWIKNLPHNIAYNPKQTEFRHYIENNKKFFLEDFSVRLENIISSITSENFREGIAEQRKQISELLHNDILFEIRVFLGEILYEKKVYILMDNLDKNWKKEADINILSEFLLRLISVGNKIDEDFKKSHTKQKSIELALIVFLRSDIFSYLKKNSTEQDKINHERLLWENHSLLHRIIEERFSYSLGYKYQGEQIWENFFVEEVNNIPTKEFITQNIIPRPRDIIYFTYIALGHAINSKHPKINQEDIIYANDRYSNHVFDSLVTELTSEFSDIETMLIELAGETAIITKEKLTELLVTDEIDYLIENLCECTFLGVEVEENNFQFMYNEIRIDVFKKRSEKTAKKLGKHRYKINTPFHNYLQIT